MSSHFVGILLVAFSRCGFFFLPEMSQRGKKMSGSSLEEFVPEEGVESVWSADPESA